MEVATKRLHAVEHPRESAAAEQAAAAAASRSPPAISGVILPLQGEPGRQQPLPRRGSAAPRPLLTLARFQASLLSVPGSYPLLAGMLIRGVSRWKGC